jgi:hypothetical protein
MFNFTDVVSDILLEQEPVTGGNDAQKIMSSAGFKELVNAYTTQYNVTPNVNDILKAASIIVGGKYIAAKYTNLGYIPFIDAFAQAYSFINDKNKSNFTQSDIINTIINDPVTFDPIFNNVAASVKNTATTQEYEPTNPDVNRAWRSLTTEMDKLSQTAIQSLGSDTIHSAITKIIAKRIPILDRVMGLKGIVKPFNQSVITPILHQFKKYTGYKQGDFQKNPAGWLKNGLWPKKVPGDFSKMVEDISANNLLNVAVLTYEYYIHLLGTQGKPLNTQIQPVNASLNLFDNFFNNLLNEEAPPWLQGPSAIQSLKRSTADKEQLLKNIAQNRKAIKSSKFKEKTLQQTQQINGLPAEQIEKISNQVGNIPDPDYTSFINNGESRYLPGIKYDLSTIAKDPSREARALYKAITDMAYFVRPRLSAAQRLGKTAGALGALRTGMGPVG